MAQNKEQQKNTTDSISEKMTDNLKGLAGKIAKPFKNKFKKQAAKMAKKAIKLAIKVLKKVLAKMLAWLISTVGVPTLLVVGISVILALLISLAMSFLWASGDGLEGDDKAIHEYIVEQSEATVDMDNPIEKPYRVPEGLIASTIMLDVFDDKKSDLDSIKKIIKKIATELAPEFEYGNYDEWKEKQVIVYEDGKKVKEGKVEHTKNEVSKLESVQYWNGSTIFNYKAHTSDWKSKEVITHKTIQVPKEVEYMETLKVPASIADITDRTFPYFNPKSKSWKDLLKEQVRQQNQKVDTTGYVTVHLKKTKTVMVDKVIEVKTITKTRNQYFTSTQNVTQDYANFDAILNSLGLGLDDKKLIEANYSFMGGSINYTDWLSQNGGVYGYDDISYDGTVIPGAGVPAQYMPIYLAAEKKYGVHWYTLAAIHSKESMFGTISPMVSPVGAIGQMQFLPATWVGWSYDVGGGLVAASVDITSPGVIKKGGGLGVDGDGDGKADPYNVTDAVYTAANYLASNGYSTDKRNAIWHYNHAEWYINDILALAEKFKTAATYEGGTEGSPTLKPGSFIKPTIGTVTSGYGARWGTKHQGIDIGLGGRSNVKIYAAADGTVSRSYLSSSYGNVVFIQHKIDGKQYETVYAHMQNRAVSAGAKVKQGQFLGYMGGTGNVTGPHLHFEVHQPSWNISKTNSIDPALLIDFK
ncbi:peptidoglycan DD-metalloendopeptidase family protein [Bacillales bacterium AN1005]